MPAFDPTMRRYALRFRDGSIEVKSMDNDRVVARFHSAADRPSFVFQFSPDGEHLAASHYPRAR